MDCVGRGGRTGGLTNNGAVELTGRMEATSTPCKPTPTCSLLTLDVVSGTGADDTEQQFVVGAAEMDLAGALSCIAQPPELFSCGATFGMVQATVE